MYRRLARASKIMAGLSSAAACGNLSQSLHRSPHGLFRTSRTRLTAIMNRNTKDISTDLLLRVLYSLGYTAKIKFQKAA
jgi:hypothetical protein